MPYTVIRSSLPEVLILEPHLYEDERGFFFESFSVRDFESATGISREFVQDNHARSAKGVLRGLHYQVVEPQGKLLRVCQGEIFDVAVDLRRSSPSFGRWTGVVLSADNRRQVWIPEGFGHGYLALSEAAEVLYKTTAYYAVEHDRCVAWNDATIGVEWPLDGDPQLSRKDREAPRLADAELFD